MSAPEDDLNYVELHTVTLRVQTVAGDTNPKDWDWTTLLELLPPQRVELVAHTTDPRRYAVGMECEWAQPAPHAAELACAQANGGTGQAASDYGYAQVLPERFEPYEPAQPHVLLAGQHFAMRVLRPGDTFGTVTVGPGGTVWLLDVVPGHDFWRVYAARTAEGNCYVLSET